MFMYFIKHKIYTVNQIHVIQYNYVYNVSNPMVLLVSSGFPSGLD